MSEEAWEQQWPQLGPQAQPQAGTWTDAAGSQQLESQEGAQEGAAGTDSPQAEAEQDAAGHREGQGQGQAQADRAAAAAGHGAGRSPAGGGDQAGPAGAGSAAGGSPPRQKPHPPPWAVQSGWEDQHVPAGQPLLSTSPASGVSGVEGHTAGPVSALVGTLTAAAAAPSSGGVETPAEAARQHLVKPQPRWGVLRSLTIGRPHLC